VREMLEIWPLFPISIRVCNDEMLGVDNIITALEHNDRVCELALHDFPLSELEEVFAAMQRPYPALTCLELQPRDETTVTVPTLFLGGSAPNLQNLFLDCVLFPELPKLLLSSTHLVKLDLRRISGSGFISPEEMVACLSVLTKLESLCIKFKPPRRRPGQKSRRSPPPTRILLPVLTELEFVGVSEYFEDIAAGIDAPLLGKLTIIFHQPIFDTLQLTLLIGRTPKLKAYYETRGPLSLSRCGCLFIDT
jgi:hypothetical protein